jgi:hypothetical protein
MKDGWRDKMSKTWADVFTAVKPRTDAEKWARVQGWREADWPAWFDRKTAIALIEWASKDGAEK